MRDSDFIRKFHAYAKTQTGDFNSWDVECCAMAQFVRHHYGKRIAYTRDYTYATKFMFGSEVIHQYPPSVYKAVMGSYGQPRTWEVLTKRLKSLL
jgi:hypothetical protein